MDFLWDPAKARANFKKHGVEFADAVGVLEDPYAITIEDPEAEAEQRFLSIGLDFLGRLLVVTWAFRGGDIRLISARKAIKKERISYEEGL